MAIKEWKILESNYFRPRFRLDKVQLSNGNILDATVLELSAWANVVAVTKNQAVVLIKQYRHGVQDVLWEIPGGVVEDGEEPLIGVKRELLEETGYTASEFIQVGKIYPNPAFQTNSMYCFLALNAERVAEQNLDGGEDIEVHLVPMDELLAMTKRGEFPHALQVAALFHVFAYLERIR
ncbi:MAG: NUDIX hydrolase [Anaerolineales bacterium]|nr:MAG: NUDIX hydrolase [Anaerolineales bacterium]